MNIIEKIGFLFFYSHDFEQKKSTITILIFQYSLVFLKIPRNQQQCSRTILGEEHLLLYSFNQIESVCYCCWKQPKAHSRLFVHVNGLQTYKPRVHARVSFTETTFLSCLKCLVGIPALSICYKMTQSRNTILIAHLADQSEHTGLIGRGAQDL